jgi:citrate synthase
VRLVSPGERLHRNTRYRTRIGSSNLKGSLVKIGKNTTPQTAICTSDSESITVRDRDLCRDLMGQVTFTEYFFFLVTGRVPTETQCKVLDATLVTIAEHGLVPSVQASRMTFAAAPDAFQGAVAAGILGCGSVILGSSQSAGRMLVDIRERATAGEYAVVAEAVVREYVARSTPVPGYGHPEHKARDPRVARLFEIAEHAGADMTYVHIVEAVEAVIPEVLGKPLKINASSAIPAVLLGIGFPITGLIGIPILARTAGLIAHLVEEREQPIGFALSYQAAKNVTYLKN